MTRTRTRLSHIAATLTIAGALVAGAAPPAQAAPVTDEHVVTVDAGNGITATIVRGCGAVTVRTPTPFVWDPWLRAMFPNSADRSSGLGDGWRVDTMFISVAGGPRYYFPEFRAMFATDATTPTGFVNYPGDNVRAENEHGVVPGREGVPDRDYYYTLHHLDTDEMKYFSWEGDLLASIKADGSRTDWVFHEVMPHRLVMLVDEGGATTRFDWDSEPGAVVIDTPDGGWIRLILDGGVLSELVTERARSVFDIAEWDHLTWQYSSIGTNDTSENGAERTKSVWLVWFVPNRPGQVERVYDDGRLVYVPPGTSR